MAYPAYAHGAVNVGGLVAGSIATGSALVGLAVFGPEAMIEVAKELENAATDAEALEALKGSTPNPTAAQLAALPNEGFTDVVLNSGAAETAAGWANGVVSFLETAQTAAANIGVAFVEGVGTVIQTVTNWIGDIASSDPNAAPWMANNPLQSAVAWLEPGTGVNELTTDPTIDSKAFWQEKAAAYVGAGAAHGAYKKLNGKSWTESVTAATPGVNLVR